MKKLFSTFVLLFVASMLVAAPVSEEQARRIASRFFSQGATRSSASVELAWSGNDLNEKSISRGASDGALLYIYNRSDAEGFVVVAGEDQASPIIAYSHECTLDVERLVPAARYLLDSWIKELKAIRNGSIANPLTPRTSEGSVVKAYETALWNQREPYNNEVPLIDGYRAITGCVATALSIICYYNKYPTKSVGTATAYNYYDPNDVLREIEAHPLGRSYDYSKMKADYSNGYTTEEGAAVAALMHDIGRSVKMQYHYSESGATGSDALQGITNHFGYSKGALLLGGDSYSRQEWYEVLKTNLNNYGPTYFSGRSNRGGHAFVLDGYTTNDYFHINYGWGGVDNGYYLLPSIEYANYQFAMCYLEPDPNGTSTYKDFLQLTPYSYNDIRYLGLRSGADTHTAGQQFTISSGAIANVGASTFNGSIALAVCDKGGTPKQILLEYSQVAIDPYYMILTPDQNVTLNTTPVEGDRLRILYKGDYSTDWQWATGETQDVIDDLVLVATPDEAAEKVTFGYQKENHIISLYAPYALQYKLTNVATGNEVASGSHPSYSDITISTESLASGEYRLDVASGGNPYQFVIVL